MRCSWKSNTWKIKVNENSPQLLFIQAGRLDTLRTLESLMLACCDDKASAEEGAVDVGAGAGVGAGPVDVTTLGLGVPGGGDHAP